MESKNQNDPHPKHATISNRTILKRMGTPYTESARQAKIPHAEYPRPQLRRADASWRSANGTWNYAIVPAKGPSFPEPEGEILVPFSPESILSEVSRQLQPHEELWYERTFRKRELPEVPVGGQLLLHFGAVDQVCEVYVNRISVGKHRGGYTSFSFDVTAQHQEMEDALTVHVKVTDPSQTGNGGYGKQTLNRGKIWYTATSGIWQSVWWEAVPAHYITEVKITPHLEASQVELIAFVFGDEEAWPKRGEVDARESLDQAPCDVKLTVNGRSFCQEVPAFALAEGGRKYVRFLVGIDDVRPWSPEDPHLYEYRLQIAEDIVDGYFAMRSFGIGKDAAGTPRLLLNGSPYQHIGVLDQGYWSDGLYTPATDQAIVDEMLEMKALGFNMLRKHIKVESMRWYYHADRLGLLVWQDMVSGGGPYKQRYVAYLPFLGFRFDDRKKLARFGREKRKGRERFEIELEETIRQLYSVPSIAVWVPFNEGWGQFEALRMYDKVKALDSTRVIDHASGWHDQGGGDLLSKHIYFTKARIRPDVTGRPAALTEFGGYSIRLKGHVFSENAFGYRMYDTLEAYQEAVLALFDFILEEGRKQKSGNTNIAAFVYTQLSDVEDEVNGLLTYDRKVNKWAQGSAAAQALKERIEALKRLS